MSILSLGAVGLLVSVVGWWIYNVCYSLFFSPLRHIPGPLVLQLCPLYELTFQITGTYSWKEREYLIFYGGVYRKGWTHVVFSSEEAMNEIYSTQAYTKSDLYLAFQTQGHNLFSTRDKDFHRERKRIMAPSFSQKEIDSFDLEIRREVVSVASSIIKAAASKGVPIDMHRLFGSITMDVIGLLGFGRNFHTLRDGHHPAEKWFQDSNLRIAFEIFFPLLRRLPNPPLSNLKQLGLQATQEAKLSLHKKYIMQTLIKAIDPITGSKLTDQDLADEALSQIFAGSDSTANSMTWALYFIVKHANVYGKVVRELISKFPSLSQDITIPDSKQGSLPYLDAAIKESMRVMPAASGALGRFVPSGGRTIDGIFVPGGTTVAVNILALHTLPTIWGKDSFEFRPERWLDGSLEDSAAFSPFSLGPRACIGRHLAMAEIRLVLATFIRQFDFQLVTPNQKLTPCAIAFTKPAENEFLLYATERMQ